ncbi:MAG: PIN domain-containing protein [Candidatus Bathyarchaeota archaeon]|nr:PIN domain-containing protein [Candidatus Bathyarchaeota archaeon]
MRDNLVLDAGILNLFFVRDARVFPYFRRISGGDAIGHVAGINLSEFYYKTCQTLGRQTADTRFNLLIESEIEVVEDPELDRQAGIEKCRRELDLSLADCYALTLTKRVNGLLLTTDSELGKTKEVETRHFPV